MLRARIPHVAICTVNNGRCESSLESNIDSNAHDNDCSAFRLIRHETDAHFRLQTSKWTLAHGGRRAFLSANRRNGVPVGTMRRNRREPPCFPSRPLIVRAHPGSLYNGRSENFFFPGGRSIVRPTIRSADPAEAPDSKHTGQSGG